MVVLQRQNKSDGITHFYFEEMEVWSGFMGERLQVERTSHCLLSGYWLILRLEHRTSAGHRPSASQTQVTALQENLTQSLHRKASAETLGRLSITDPPSATEANITMSIWRRQHMFHCRETPLELVKCLV